MAKVASKTFEGDVFTVTFASGQDLTLDMNDLGPEILQRLAKHGLSQKVGDSYAGATPEEAYGLAKSVVDDLLQNLWTTRTAGSPRATQLADALARATGQPLEAAVAKLEEMDDDQKAALRKHAQIAKQLAIIKAEIAAKAAERAETAAASGEAEPLPL